MLGDLHCRQRALPLFHDLEDVKTRPRTHRTGHGACRQPVDRLHKQLRVAVETAQAKLPAGLRGVGRVGRLGSELGKIFSRPRPARKALGAGLQHTYLCRRRIFRHGDQNLGEVDCDGGRIDLFELFADELVNIRLTHAHPWLDVAFTQTRHGQLGTKVLTELRDRNFLLDQPLAQLGDVQLILAGNIDLRLVNRRVVHLDTGLAGVLDLRPLVDQALEDLPGQHLATGQSCAFAYQLLLQPHQPGFDLVVGDRFTVDHRNNEIRRALRRHRRRRADHALAQADRRAKALGLHQGGQAHQQGHSQGNRAQAAVQGCEVSSHSC